MMADHAPEIDDGLADAKCAAMRWNTPLSEAHAELLLSRLELPTSGSVLDLGCGWGELLIRAVTATGEAAVMGTGVDTYVPDLERGRRAAAERGLGDRVAFVEASAVGWSEPAGVGRYRGGARCAGGERETRWAAPVRRRLLGARAW
jgi:hypothetical protein